MIAGPLAGGLAPWSGDPGPVGLQHGESLPLPRVEDAPGSGFGGTSFSTAPRHFHSIAAPQAPAPSR